MDLANTSSKSKEWLQLFSLTIHRAVSDETRKWNNHLVGLVRKKERIILSFCETKLYNKHFKLKKITEFWHIKQKTCYQKTTNGYY